MGLKINEFPRDRKFKHMDTETKKASSFLEPRIDVKKISDIKRDEEREDQMFPPNFLTLITIGKPN